MWGTPMMAVNPRSANGSRRRALLRRMRAAGGTCWICGLPIDYSLPAGNPLAFECDELVPVSKGGSPYDIGNVAGSHRLCNQWRSNKSVSEVNAIKSEVTKRFGGWSTPSQFVELAKAIVKGGRASRAPIRHPKKHSSL